MRVMIVEDEPLLAMLLEALVVEVGCDVTGCVPTRQGALELAEREPPDLAFVDIRLADGITGPEVALDLSSRKIAVVFLTSSLDLVPANMAGAVGLVTKPYVETDMESVIAFMASAMQDGAVPPAPPALHLAPTGMESRNGRYHLSMAG